MSVTVVFSCGGCSAKADGTTFIQREFEQLTSMFGKWLPWDVDAATPEGWVASDPYTGCCYCPECWMFIIEDRQVEARRR